MIREQDIDCVKGSEAEEVVTEKEVEAIMAKILDLGDGDIIDGTIKAVEAGVLDTPGVPTLTSKTRCWGCVTLTALAAI